MAIVNGTPGNDTLEGGTGHDTLYGGGGGVDQFYGGAGDDTYVSDGCFSAFIFNSPGADTTLGSEGQEFFYYTSYYSPVLDAETFHGGGGNDSLFINLAVSSAENFWLDARPDANGLGHASYGLTFSGIENFDINTGSGADSITMGDTDDKVFSGLGNDTVGGGAGRDSLRGSFGNDTIFGGDDGDTIDGDQGEGSYGDDTLYGGAGDDLVGGSGGSDRLWGDSGDDALYGGDGQDTLEGGSGTDALDGGAGDDVYVIRDTVDSVTETTNAGVDQVNASVSYVLGAELENLLLLGSAAINGTGNALANLLTGGIGANTLSGKAGNDSLLGNSGNDVLLGGAGHDTLDGGKGTDRLEGGRGYDVYVLATKVDTVVELAGGGLDQVNAGFNYALGAEIENLVLTGNADLSGTGNSLDNRLTGNAGANFLKGLDGKDRLHGGDGNDLLNGGAGSDTMEGGGGDDTFVVDSLGDKVVELVGSGTDQVKASVTVTLANNVEILVLKGSALIDGTGNKLANSLTGNAAANHLYGGRGHDTLSGANGDDVLEGDKGNDVLFGNGGADTFRFETGRDTIRDIQNNTDTLAFDDALWGGGARTAAEIMGYARLEGTNAVFDFGSGRSLTVEGVTSLNALSDDVTWF